MANLPTLCVICPAADIHYAGLMDCLLLACFRALLLGSASGLCLFVVGVGWLRYRAV